MSRNADDNFKRYMENRFEQLLEDYSELEEELDEKAQEQYLAIIQAELTECGDDLCNAVVQQVETRGVSLLVVAAALREWKLEFPYASPLQLATPGRKH